MWSLHAPGGMHCWLATYAHCIIKMGIVKVAAGYYGMG